LSRVYHVVNQALNNDLYVVINIHHYEEIFQQPVEHKERFLSLWQQIGTHFKDFPNTLVFEVLNEPHDNFTAALWNQYFPEVINIIRETNPNRTIIIGTAGWGRIGALNQLSLPDDDDNLIVTVHYYEPFTFTHQGAEWVEGSNAWLGTTWSATAQQRKELSQHFSQVKAWADVHNRPVYIGEFGAYSKADMNSRALWTGYVVNQCKQNEFSWAYWEFCSGFGIYDASTGKWRQQLLNALIQVP
jgi:endoglucanase